MAANERFVNLPNMSNENAEKVADAINAALVSDGCPRHWRVVENDYEPQPDGDTKVNPKKGPIEKLGRPKTGSEIKALRADLNRIRIEAILVGVVAALALISGVFNWMAVVPAFILVYAAFLITESLKKRIKLNQTIESPELSELTGVRPVDRLTDYEGLIKNPNTSKTVINYIKLITDTGRSFPTLGEFNAMLEEQSLYEKDRDSKRAMDAVMSATDDIAQTISVGSIR